MSRLNQICHHTFILRDIHPFEDGNGRIGRVLAEKSLYQELGHTVAISLSTIIEKNKTEYYESLKSAQRTLDITDWILYFGNLILNAPKAAQSLIELIIKKARYFEQF